VVAAVTAAVEIVEVAVEVVEVAVEIVVVVAVVVVAAAAVVGVAPLRRRMAVCIRRLRRLRAPRARARGDRTLGTS
jgi:hypothetical protein